MGWMAAPVMIGAINTGVTYGSLALTTLSGAGALLSAEEQRKQSEEAAKQEAQFARREYELKSKEQKNKSNRDRIALHKAVAKQEGRIRAVLAARQGDQKLANELAIESGISLRQLKDKYDVGDAGLRLGLESKWAKLPQPPDRNERLLAAFTSGAAGFTAGAELFPVKKQKIPVLKGDAEPWADDDMFIPTRPA